MPYEVTATRKRPQSFDDLVGQEFVASTIRHSIEQGRIANAYLFAGPRGVGKTSVARILAKSLNCETGPTASPCGTCSSCREIARGAALDVIEIDGASNTSVNDMREIKDEVLFAPNGGKHKVYIIDEVHMLSNSAFNALLKTIEEPPPHVVFIFATTEIHKVPATIRSRCQQYTFRLIPPDEIVRMLEQAASELGIKAEPDALFWIAKESTGSLRDAYTLLDQAASFSGEAITLKGIREKLGVMDFDTMNELAEGVRKGDAAYVLERTHDILAGGVSIEQFVVDMAEYFRNVLFLKHGIRRQHLLGYPPSQFRQEVVDAFGAEQLEKAVELFLELHRNLRYSLSPLFELEIVMARLADLRRLVSAREVLDTIAAARAEFGRSRPAAGGIGSPSRPATPPAARVRVEAPAEPSAPPAIAATAAGGTDRERWATVVEACKKEKPILASALDKAAAVHATERAVEVSFRAEDRFQAEMVEAERALLATRGSAAFGRPITVEVKILAGEVRRPAAVDDRVELVKRVFGGEIVEGGD
jgi:DNA polymerase III subunit gamma/tau